MPRSQATFVAKLYCDFGDKMDWTRWVADSVLGARTRSDLEAEGAPELLAALAPTLPIAAQPPAPALRFNIEKPLRVPRTDKGAFIAKGNRLLRTLFLKSEMHESVFRSPKSIVVECMGSDGIKCAGRLRLVSMKYLYRL